MGQSHRSYNLKYVFKIPEAYTNSSLLCKNDKKELTSSCYSIFVGKRKFAYTVFTEIVP